MRIVYLHQYFNTADMAGSTRSYELGRRLVQKGHEVHMVTADREPSGRNQQDWRTTVENGLIVHWANVPYDNAMSFGQRLKAFLRYAWMAARKASRIDADVIYATSTPLTIALPAVYASRRQKIPMVFEVRDLWPQGPIALGVLKNSALIAMARWLERFAYRNSARIVALAPGMKDGVAMAGYPVDRIAVIPNGCDIELFNGGKEAARAIRSEHDWLQDRKLVSYIGTLGRVNDASYMAYLAKSVRELDPEIRFVIIGSGADAANIREVAESIGVLDQNFFMLPTLPKSRIAGWFCASTISASWARAPREVLKDSTTNKYFDAMAAGRPLVSNYDGWQIQIAKAAGAGIVLDADDHDRAARQLMEVLGNSAWLARASQASRALATAEFSREEHAENLESVLQEAVRSSGQGIR